jgi:hypothetical protein
VVVVLWLRGRATGKPKREPIPVREKGFVLMRAEGDQCVAKERSLFSF